MNHRIRQKQFLADSLTVLISVIFFAACTSQPSYPHAAKIGANLVVEEASLQLETPKFFTYQFNNKKISFFILHMNNVTQSYLDACASCYPHKRGYQYENNAVTCRYCSQRFSVNKLDKGFGGCYPIKIEGRTEKGKYLIPVAALEAEAEKF